jgi:hypothetical protein
VSWSTLEYVGKGHYRLNIRKWHPGLWVEVFRTLRGAGNGLFESLWYTAYFVVKV